MWREFLLEQEIMYRNVLTNIPVWLEKSMLQCRYEYLFLSINTRISVGVPFRT